MWKKYFILCNFRCPESPQGPTLHHNSPEQNRTERSPLQKRIIAGFQWYVLDAFHFMTQTSKPPLFLAQNAHVFNCYLEDT